MLLAVGPIAERSTVLVQEMSTSHPARKQKTRRRASRPAGRGRQLLARSCDVESLAATVSSGTSTPARLTLATPSGSGNRISSLAGVWRDVSRRFGVRHRCAVAARVTQAALKAALRQFDPQHIYTGFGRPDRRPRRRDAHDHKYRTRC